MHRTIFALALATMLGLLVFSLLGCVPCTAERNGCVTLTDRWEGVN